jgi:hypothetical protein
MFISDLGSDFSIPDPDPGLKRSRIRIRIKSSYYVLKNKIRDVNPTSESVFCPSRIQDPGVKKHRIPDPDRSTAYLENHPYFSVSITEHLLYKMARCTDIKRLKLLTYCLVGLAEKLLLMNHGGRLLVPEE